MYVVFSSAALTGVTTVGGLFPELMGELSFDVHTNLDLLPLGEKHAFLQLLFQPIHDTEDYYM